MAGFNPFKLLRASDATLLGRQSVATDDGSGQTGYALAVVQVGHGSDALTPLSVSVNSATYVDVVAAPGANLRWYMTGLLLSWAGAALTTVTVSLDGGTTANIIHNCASSGGGLALSLAASPVPCGVNTKIQAKQGSASAGLSVTFFGFKAP